VLASIREKLASARTGKPQKILHAIVEALSEGRGYAWTGIYLAVEKREVWQAASGPAPSSIDINEVKAEIAVPVRLGARTLGLIVAETGRALNAARQERVLLQQTARLVAQYLTTDRAKQLLRKTREQARQTAAVPLQKSPQSARPVARRAAAGERIPR
jgi:putative methionine-R-sulfoxide reductase with GAF domain